MKYRDLDKKTRELKIKYKSLQDILKNDNIKSDISMKLCEYEKETFKKYLFYNNLKKEISKR